MPGATFRYDDDDDHGIPILQIPHRTRAQRLRLTYLRYRTPVLIIAAIIFLLYWTKGTEIETTDWSRLAYAQYATDAHTLCNAVMIFESLKTLGSKADRVLLYPEQWSDGLLNTEERVEQLLYRAKKLYGVKLNPVQLLSLDGPGSAGTFKHPSDYDTSLTKFRLFELEEYDRVIYFDGDSLLQDHMDELFQLPHTAVAMPRAYWSDKPRNQWPLSSTLMVVSPNSAETKHLYDTLQKWRYDPGRTDSTHFDDDILNDRFGSSALVLPHRPYLLQSSEFRWKEHSAYLGAYGTPDAADKWVPHLALKEAKLIHFNDWPLPKPWIMWPLEGLNEIQPDCGGPTKPTCVERDVWKGLYEDFRKKRRDVCKLLSVPAPKWEKHKEEAGAGSSGPSQKV